MIASLRWGGKSEHAQVKAWSRVAGNTRRASNGIEVRAVTPSAKANGFLRE
jgi:hypothetical protein